MSTNTILFSLIFFIYPSLANTSTEIPLANTIKPKARVLFYENDESITRDTCILITSQKEFQKYTYKRYDIDFKKNHVVLICKPWISTYHKLTYKSIDQIKDTLVVTYRYEVTMQEVEGPPKKMAILIPAAKGPVKLREERVFKEMEGVRERVL